MRTPALLRRRMAAPDREGRRGPTAPQALSMRDRRSGNAGLHKSVARLRRHPETQVHRQGQRIRDVVGPLRESRHRRPLETSPDLMTRPRCRRIAPVENQGRGPTWSPTKSVRGVREAPGPGHLRRGPLSSRHLIRSGAGDEASRHATAVPQSGSEPWLRLASTQSGQSWQSHHRSQSPSGASSSGEAEGRGSPAFRSAARADPSG